MRDVSLLWLGSLRPVIVAVASDVYSVGGMTTS